MSRKLCTIGARHTPRIRPGTYVVGTSGPVDLDYRNAGPTPWNANAVPLLPEFTAADFHGMTDGEYLHNASRGLVPGVPAVIVDALTIEYLVYSDAGLAGARRVLVEEYQRHGSDEAKAAALLRCA